MKTSIASLHSQVFDIQTGEKILKQACDFASIIIVTQAEGI